MLADDAEPPGRVENERRRQRPERQDRQPVENGADHVCAPVESDERDGLYGCHDCDKRPHTGDRDGTEQPAITREESEGIPIEHHAPR